MAWLIDQMLEGISLAPLWKFIQSQVGQTIIQVLSDLGEAKLLVPPE